MKHLSQLLETANGAPSWVAALVLLAAVLLCVRIAPQIVSAFRAAQNKWREVDERSFRATRANYQKSHEADNRSF